MLNVYRLGRKRCDFCCDHNMDSVSHILFDCAFVESVRKPYWLCVREAGVLNLCNEIENMDVVTRCKFIFSGFKGDFIYEWNGFYRAMLMFIYKVYTSYYKALS